MSFIQVGDAIQLGKLALDLYQKVFLVAKAAPETFGKLLRELIIVKNVLYRIDRRFAREGRLHYDDATRDALMLCNEALLIFKPLVIKYKKLASANGSNLRQKLKFPFDQGKIKTAREELEKAINILNFALSADLALGPADLPSPSSEKAAHRPSNPTVEGGDDVSAIGQKIQARRLLEGPSERTGSLPEILRTQRISSTESVPEPVARIQRIHTLETNGDDHLMPVAPESSHADARHSTESSLRSQKSRSSFTSIASNTPESKPLPSASPVSPPDQHDYFRAFDFAKVKPTLTDPDGSDIGDSDDRIEIDTEDRDDIVDKLGNYPAFQQLEPKFAVEIENFKSQRAERFKNYDGGLKECLSCGTWWLLKSRKIMEVIRADQVGTCQQRSTWPTKISRGQAAVDLLKACYIVKNIIFSKETLGRPVKNSTWKGAKDIISAVHDEISLDDTINILNSSNSGLDRLHLSFSETIHQPVEAAKQLPAALDSFQPSRRWLTIYTDHAGDARERVLFRTFVNAQIGEESVRRKSPSAPYLLVLWSQHGRSEVIVSLANQIGTVNLCCTLTEQDLRKHEAHVRPSLEFELSFPSQDTVVQFLNLSELNDFLQYPKNFFKVTSEREARPEEFLVFREGLYAFDQRSNALGPRSSISGGIVNQARSSCEVSLYELVPSECWKTQRRIVISSALDATDPWCYSYWLPISQVRATGQGRDVELHWSDCNQLEKKSNGNYGHNHSLVYRPDSPNVNINMQFQDAEAAGEFKAAILRPWVVPFETDNLKCKASFGSAGGADDSPSSAPVGQELSVWQLMDADGAMRQIYLSIVYVERNAQSGFLTNVYFVHRDVDFAMEQVGKNSVSFELLRVPRPVSNVRNLKYPPKEKGACEDVEWGFANADFHFENDGDIPRFMKSLIGWELVFCCRASSVQSGILMKPGTWRQRDIIVTVWSALEEAGVNRGLRVATRWMGDVQTSKDYKWSVAVVSSTTNCTIGPGASKVILKDIELARGVQLDVKKLVAVDFKGRIESQHKKTLVLTMPDALAAHHMHNVATKALNPSWAQIDTSTIYRPVSATTGTGSSWSSNDASKFLH